MDILIWVFVICNWMIPGIHQSGRNWIWIISWFKRSCNLSQWRFFVGITGRILSDCILDLFQMWYPNWYHSKWIGEKLIHYFRALRFNSLNKYQFQLKMLHDPLVTDFFLSNNCPDLFIFLSVRHWHMVYNVPNLTTWYQTRQHTLLTGSPRTDELLCISASSHVKHA